MTSVNKEAASSSTVEIASIGNAVRPSSIDPDHLLKAAADGNIEPFKTQMAEQLDLIVTPIKNTVLHMNITSENVSIEFVEKILGICPSLLCKVNAQGDTPLHVAAKFGRVKVVDVLIKHAKTQHAELESGTGSAKRMLRMINSKGNTPLHEAAGNQEVSVVKVLAKEDSDFPYFANKFGESPLYIAVETGFSHGVTEMLDTCRQMVHVGPNGMTALHAAVRRNCPGLTRDILQKKKRLTKEIDENGWTPLHCAAYYDRSEVTRILLESDKSVAYIADKDREMTPLHLAASQGHIDIIKEIILFCPDCYVLVDKRGWNVLHFAMASLSKNNLCSLLENPLIKKLVHEKDAKGNTPLHVLATCTSSLCALDFFDDIIEQVKGDRRAVNRRNFNVAETFNDGCPELQQEILALSEDTNVGPYARGVIHIQGKHYDEYFSQIKGAKESHLVAAALIATVTYAAAFTLPGGYKSERGKNQGTAILSRESAFQAFVITDAVAMVSSISAVFIFFIMSVERFKMYWYLFELGSWFTVVAMGAMVIAFVAGMYAVLAPSLWLATVSCLIGSGFFLLLIPVGFSIILDLIKSKPQWKRKMKSVANFLKSKLVDR